MDFPGDVLTCSGTVTGTEEGEGFGYVDCQVELTNSRGQRTAWGRGRLALPRRGQRLPLVWQEEAW
jgi:hypothetical protein